MDSFNSISKVKEKSLKLLVIEAKTQSFQGGAKIQFKNWTGREIHVVRLFEQSV